MKKLDVANNYKIKLVYHDLEGNIAVESMWASKEGNAYRIKNVPFFAPNIAYNDLVSVEKDDDELYFDELIEASGHSTIQIIIYNPDELSQIGKELNKLGCDWEGSHLKGYISVDVPKNISYSNVKAYLDKGEKEGRWSYKEACLAH